MSDKPWDLRRTSRRRLAATADAPQEVTEKMVEDGMQAMGYKAEGRPYGGARQRFIKGLRAALTARKGE